MIEKKPIVVKLKDEESKKVESKQESYGSEYYDEEDDKEPKPEQLKKQTQ